MAKVFHIIESRKIRNATWKLVWLDDMRQAVYMNGRLQRIFTDFLSAQLFFETYARIK